MFSETGAVGKGLLGPPRRSSDRTVASLWPAACSGSLVVPSRPRDSAARNRGAPGRPPENRNTRRGARAFGEQVDRSHRQGRDPSATCRPCHSRTGGRAACREFRARGRRGAAGDSAPSPRGFAPGLADRRLLLPAAIAEHDLAVLHPSSPFEIVRITRYARALPQYDLDHTSRIEALQHTERDWPGLSFLGNYRGGVS